MGGIKMEPQTHTCKETPLNYTLATNEQGDWSVQDPLYKYVDRIKYCPYCGERLQ